MTWLYARLLCWRRGHDFRLITTDGRYLACHGCGRQEERDIEQGVEA